jgi:uncharacterized protein
MTSRKYAFSWDLIGDIDLGRPNLGPTTRIEVYRLMQFAFRDVLEQQFGTAEADRIFRQAGQLAGREFYKKFCDGIDELQEFVRTLQSLLRELNIGIMRVESADTDNGSFVITISEDLDCSGLPELDYETCVYDEGFITGLMESFTGQRFQVKEVDCWCTGDRTCRFRATRIPEP